MARLTTVASLMLLGSTAVAAPIVTDSTISWPDDGWYQVQRVTDNGYIEQCQGGLACNVSAGEYVVINHSTAERFTVTVATDTPLASGVSVVGNVISWPDDGWYQVLNELDYTELCSGVRSCVAPVGSYLVINHTTGERFDGIVVNEDSDQLTPIAITNNTISWPDDGWYQVQSSTTYNSFCEGGTSCDVPAGVYKVINHSSGMSWDGITVGTSSSNTTQVDFAITVPVYQSDELQVSLMWGDEVINAGWVSGELWSISQDFSADTERLLTVTFFDRNGGIELGSYDAQFQTGQNEAETHTIEADQFNISRWDADEDGVSNLDELIAGTDPLVDESSLIEINDSYGLFFIRSISQDFESTLSEERPYSESVEAIEYNDEGSGDTRRYSLNINIDAGGNGTVEQQFSLRQNSQSKTGTRTNSGSGISWEAEWRSHDGDYTHRYRINNEISIVDENTRSFIEQYYYSYYGTYYDNRSVVSDLIGQRIDEGSSLCEPVSGTVSVTTSSTRSTGNSSTTNISKQIDDPYWRVVIVSDDGYVAESFARELRMDNFICDFVDF